MMDTDPADLKRRLKAAGIKQKDVADALDLTPNKISLSLDGQREFKVREIDYIRDLLAEKEGAPAREPARAIPILAVVPAGNWKEAIRNPRGWMPAPEGSVPRNAYAVDIDGDSMDRVAADGSRAILDPDDLDLYPERYYVILSPEGDVTFKQFMLDPVRLVPCSSNPAHHEIPIGREGFEVLARVVGVYKKL